MLPGIEAFEWKRIVNEKCRVLGSVRWRDSRPLTLIVGDSHVEIADWYNLYQGAHAVRNCGLSRAKIADVARIVSSISEREPAALILLCGINDIGSERTLDQCVADYTALLAVARKVLHPKRIVAVSVFPVSSSFMNSHLRDMNSRAVGLNTALRAVCNREGAEFLDVVGALGDANGGLAAELTADGLHLNAAGYSKLATAMEGAFAQAN